jgi:hypothetical protein
MTRMYGAARIAVLLQKLHNILADIMRSNPGLKDELKLGELLIEKVRGEKEEELALAVYFCTNRAHRVASYELGTTPEEYILRRGEARAKKGKKDAAFEKATPKVAALIFLNTTLPSGVMGRNADADQCDEAGGLWHAVAKMLRKNGPPGAKLGEVCATDAEVSMKLAA